MKEQAIDLHGYAPDEIRIAGAPQWDLYFRGGVTTSRGAFFGRIGADPARRLNHADDDARALYSHHDHLLRVMIGRCVRARGGTMRRSSSVCTPRDEIEAYAAFQGVPHVIIENRSGRR